MRTDKGVAEFIDFREEAPSAANETMFKNDPLLSEVGGLSVAVPYV